MLSTHFLSHQCCWLSSFHFWNVITIHCPVFNVVCCPVVIFQNVGVISWPVINVVGCPAVVIFVKMSSSSVDQLSIVQWSLFKSTMLVVQVSFFKMILHWLIINVVGCPIIIFQNVGVNSWAVITDMCCPGDIFWNVAILHWPITMFSVVQWSLFEMSESSASKLSMLLVVQ